MSIKHKKLKRLIKRFLIIFFSILAFITILIFVLFYINKDDISRRILLKANNIQNGEMKFNDISLAPFAHFPSVSLRLDEINYYEKKSTFRISDSIPIVRLNNLYIAINIVDLLRGDLNISKIHLSDGNINLVKYADSAFNIINAIGIKPDTVQQKNNSVKQQEDYFELDIERISIQNVEITYYNTPDLTNSAFKVQNLVSSFNYLPDTIKCSLNISILIEEAQISKSVSFIQKQLKLESSLSYNRNSKNLQIEPSSLSFELASFTTQGIISLSDEGYIDIELKGNDREFSMLDVFLSKEGVKMVKGGNLYYNGTIKGKLFTGIPNANLNFGLNDVIIEIPNSADKINNFDLKGEFSSGIKADMSDFKLNISELSAQLPGGQVNGNFSFQNLQKPVYDLDFYLKAEVDGFEKVFDLGMIDSLSGKFECKAKISGVLDLAENSYCNRKGNTQIKFDSISFSIPGVNSIKNLHGRLLFEADTLWFNDIYANYGTSDFTINGMLKNTLSLFLDTDTVISGDLHIKSKMYDFPDFFSWDQRTAQAFPYRIKNINLFVTPTTSKRKLTEFINTPSINFVVNHLDAEVEGFLPPVSVMRGVFELGDQDSSLLLDFKKFDISLAGSKLMADMHYISPPLDPYWFTVNLDAADLDPKKTFVHWFSDTIPEFMNGKLNTRLDFKLVSSNDSLIEFDSLSLVAHKLDYINTKDTFDIYQMRINTENVDYDLSTSSNFLENLSFEMDLKLDTFATNYFKINEVHDEIIANSGVIQITPYNSQFFDQLAEGLITLSPFAEPPTYEFNYAVKQFDIAALFDTFLEDTILSGKMDFELELKLAGLGWDEMKKNLNGKLYMYGSDLTLFGLDLDKLIKRFERSQRFTLADVGAIFLMGPAGILVTKTTDYANIIILNHGDSCTIKEVSSNWDINDGIISLTDVAISTNKNRMAALGTIDLATDSLNVKVALLNKKGCVEFGQKFSGSLKDPKTGKLSVLKSLVAPVTNLVKTATGDQCKVIYEGVVKQPKKEKEVDPL